MILLLLIAFGIGVFAYREYAIYSVDAVPYRLPTAQTDAWLAGDWFVADVAGSSRETYIDKDEAAALVGKTAHVRDHTFVFDDLDCPASMNQSIEKLVTFLRDHGATPFILRIHIPATKIDAGCADVYPFAQDMAFVSWEGYFLEVVRRSPPQQAEENKAIANQHIETIRRVHHPSYMRTTAF